jgi:hypothetical protein
MAVVRDAAAGPVELGERLEAVRGVDIADLTLLLIELLETLERRRVVLFP